MLKKLLLIVLIYLLIPIKCSLAEDSQVSQNADTNTKVRFLFLVPSDKINLSVDVVKIIDESGADVSVFDLGGAESGGCEIPSDEYVGHWGDPIEIDGVSCRKINEKDSQWEHSVFDMVLPRPLTTGDALVVRYKDDFVELVPVSFVSGTSIIRIGQIYCSGSGQWTEDVLDIPVK